MAEYIRVEKLDATHESDEQGLQSNTLTNQRTGKRCARAAWDSGAYYRRFGGVGLRCPSRHYEPGQSEIGFKLSQPHFIDADELGRDSHILVTVHSRGRCLSAVQRVCSFFPGDETSCRLDPMPTGDRIHTKSYTIFRGEYFLENGEAMYTLTFT